MGKGSRCIIETETSVSAETHADTHAPAPSQASNAVDIDMTAPLVWQVWSKAGETGNDRLNRDMYTKWVHEPHFFSTSRSLSTANGSHSSASQQNAIFFHHPVLEFFSKTSWYVIPLVWLPVISALVLNGARSLPVVDVFLLFSVGVAYWSFVEYMVHRFVFHMDEMVPDSQLGITLHFLLHGCHHKVPTDRFRLVFPPVALFTLAIPVGVLTRIASMWLVPSLEAFLILYAGTLFGYVMYDLVHYATHHGNFSPKSFLGRIRKYHLRHHFNDQYQEGFGITTPFWDHVFGTVLTMGEK